VHDAAREHALLDGGGDEPALRIWLMARMWCSWPCSTPLPAARSTPSEVPYSEASMSWVASALPANSTST
jgi:hypothetical protein